MGDDNPKYRKTWKELKCSQDKETRAQIQGFFTADIQELKQVYTEIRIGKVVCEKEIPYCTTTIGALGKTRAMCNTDSNSSRYIDITNITSWKDLQVYSSVEIYLHKKEKDLKEFIKDRSPSFSKLEKKWLDPHFSKRLALCAQLILDLVPALKTLHLNKIYHLDIKPNNILLGEKLESNEYNEYKGFFSDFGTSYFEDGENILDVWYIQHPRQFISNLIGTPLYFPPELFKDPKN